MPIEKLIYMSENLKQEYYCRLDSFVPIIRRKNIRVLLIYSPTCSILAQPLLFKKNTKLL